MAEKKAVSDAPMRVRSPLRSILTKTFPGMLCEQENL